MNDAEHFTGAETASGYPELRAGPNAAEWIPEMTRRIVDQFHPVRVILFGSQARGDASPDSDVDLLVVLDAAPDERRAAIEIRRALRGIPVCKDVIVTT